MSDQVLTIVDTLGMATAAQIRARVNRIQEVMQSVFKPDVHYGRIPGTDKPTLYKAGSEVILTMFRIGVEPIVEDLSTPDCARYRVACKGVLPTGEIVGVGIGEASTDEEKYRWRRAVCDQEFEETPEDRRRVKWAKGNGNPYQTKQVRTNPADVANTVLKMAKKRAQIDLTLTATAASDVFSQDLEDMPVEVRESVVGEDGETKPTSPAPQRKSAAASSGVTVADVETFKGTGKNGKPYEKYTVKFSDGRKASTFDTKIRDAAIGLAGSGSEVEPVIEDKGGYSTLTELMAVHDADAHA